MRRAFCAITSNRPASIAAVSSSADPTPTATAPARIQSPAFSRLTPPVGISFTWGNGARTSFMYCGPSAVAGNSLFEDRLKGGVDAAARARSLLGNRLDGELDASSLHEVLLATTELGVDGWVTDLMTPAFGKAAGWLLVVATFTSELLLGFPQSVWFSAMAATAFALFRIDQAGAWRRVPALAGAVSVAMLIGALQWLPTVDVSRASIRTLLGYEFRTSFSMHPWNLLQLWSLNPNGC